MALDQLRILIIEDDDEIRTTLGQILDLEGYSVVGAENGRIGFECLAAAVKMPDIILLDHQMPVMDGGEFIQIWKNSEYKKIPILMLSAATPQELSVFQIETLAKPFNVDDLVIRIKKIIASKEALKIKSLVPEFLQLGNPIESSRSA